MQINGPVNRFIDKDDVDIKATLSNVPPTIFPAIIGPTIVILLAAEELTPAFTPPYTVPVTFNFAAAVINISELELEGTEHCQIKSPVTFTVAFPVIRIGTEVLDTVVLENKFPVKFRVPVLEIKMPEFPLLDTVKIFPIIFSVPVPECSTVGVASLTLEGVILPTNEAFPDREIAKDISLAPLLEVAPDINPPEVAVKVTPSARSNPPLATIPVDEVFLTDNTVALTFTTTLKLLLKTSSAVVGKDPVFHTVGSLQLPALIAYTFAIIRYYLKDLESVLQ